MADDCFGKIKEQIAKGGLKVSDAQLKRVIQDMERIKEGSALDPSLGTFEERAKKYYKETQEFQALKITEFMRESRQHLANIRFVENQGFENPKEGILSTLVQSKAQANGARLGVENIREVIQNDWKNVRDVALEKQGMTKIYLSGEMDLDILKAKRALRLGEDVSGLDPRAVTIAESLNTLDKVMLKDQQTHGMYTKNLQDRIMMQTHSPEKLLELGEEKWIERVRAYGIDRERTFGAFAGNVRKENEILSSVYAHIVGGKVDEKYGAMAGVYNAGDLARDGSVDLVQRIGRSRALHFSDAEGVYNYNKDFGTGNLAENLEAEISSKSRVLAMHDRFGADPEEAFQKLISDTAQSFRAEGKLDLAKSIEPNPNEKGRKRFDTQLMNTFDEISGKNSIPVSEGWARAGSTTRMITSAAMLGKSGLASLSNVVFTIEQVRSTTGDNLFTSSGKVMAEYVKSLSPTYKKESLRMMGHALEDVSREISRLGGPIEQRTLGQMMKYVSTTSLLKTFTDAPKVAYGNLFMDAAAKELKSGNPSTGMLQAMALAGFDKADFAVLTQGISKVGEREMLSPHGISQIPLESVYARAKDLKMSPERYLYDLELKYGAYLNSQLRFVSTTPGARDSALVNFGTQAGTPLGEATRTAMQFKSVLVQAFNAFDQTLNSKPNAQLLRERGILQSEGKNYAGAAFLVTGGMTIGALRGAVENMLKGEEVDTEVSAKNVTEALAKSGMGGIFGELILSPYYQYGARGSVATAAFGPTFGAPAVLAQEAGARALRGEYSGSGRKETKAREKLLMDSIKETRRHIPLQNALLFKQGFDYLQNEVILENIQPGYNAKRDRMIRRRERKR